MIELISGIVSLLALIITFFIGKRHERKEKEKEADKKNKEEIEKQKEAREKAKSTGEKISEGNKKFQEISRGQNAIGFKHNELLAEFNSRPKLLREICYDFAYWSKEKFGITPVVTRVLEKVDGSSGVHEQGRAVDFRDEITGKRTYTDEQVKFLCNYINNKYKRSDDKPTCLHHSFQGGPLHFHIQIQA